MEGEMRNWEEEIKRRADMAQDAERAQLEADRENELTAATLRRVFLDIERARHARQLAALWFVLGLSLAANALLWWVR
jgi:hypothetical protein